MKNLTIHLFATFILVLCLGNNASAQGGGKGNQTVTPINPIFALPAGTKPDLIISNFELTSAAIITSTSKVGNATYRNFSVNYKATVKNQGTAASGVCNTQRRVKKAGSGIFAEAGADSFAALNAGASRTISGVVSFSQISTDHRSAQVMLRVDGRAEGTEFLPDYNFVNELNENNNNSTALTIDLP